MEDDFIPDHVAAWLLHGRDHIAAINQVDSAGLLFIGSETARNLVADRGIRAVVSLTDLQPLTPVDVPEYHFSLTDDRAANLIPVLDEALPLIAAHIRVGEPVLVHCAAGISRSAAVVVAYLVLTEGVTVDQALAHLRSVRPLVEPNSGFMTQLYFWRAGLPPRA